MPECDAAYERKFEEWQARNWPDWLAMNLTFPFTVTREEDEEDAYFSPGAAKVRFRLGHKMDVLELPEADVDRGVMVRVMENGQVGYVPLADGGGDGQDGPKFLASPRICGLVCQSWLTT